MQFTEFAAMPAKELKKKAAELRKELFEARMKNSMGQLANTMTIRGLRKDIARVHTALSQQTRTKAKG